MKVLVKETLSQHKFKDTNGYLICTDCILARTGNQTYKKNEVLSTDDESEVEVDRPYNEVFDSRTLASFENVPLCKDHPDEDVTPENHNSYSVGFVRNIRQGKDGNLDVIIGDLVITDADVIKLVEDGEYCELSCGYNTDIVGDDKNGYKQTNIRGNHVALCECGRAGNARIVDSITKDSEYRIVSYNNKWYYEIKQDDGFTKLVGPYSSEKEAREYFMKHRPNEKLKDSREVYLQELKKGDTCKDPYYNDEYKIEEILSDGYYRVRSLESGKVFTLTPRKRVVIDSVRDSNIIANVYNKSGKLLETKHFTSRSQLDNYVNMIDNLVDMTANNDVLYKNKLGQLGSQDVWKIIVGDSVKDANFNVGQKFRTRATVELDDGYLGLSSSQEYELKRYAERFGYDMREVYNGLNSRVSREGMSLQKAIEDIENKMAASKSLYDSAIKDSYVKTVYKDTKSNLYIEYELDSKVFYIASDDDKDTQVFKSLEEAKRYLERNRNDLTRILLQDSAIQDKSIADAKLVIPMRTARENLPDIDEGLHWYNTRYGSLNFNKNDSYLTIEGSQSDLDKFVKQYHLNDSINDMADMSRFEPMKSETREIFQQPDKRTIANIESFVRNVEQYNKKPDAQIENLIRSLYEDIVADYDADVKDFGKDKVKNHRYYANFINALKKLDNKVKGVKMIDSIVGDSSKYTFVVDVSRADREEVSKFITVARRVGFTTEIRGYNVLLKNGDALMLRKLESMISSRNIYFDDVIVNDSDEVVKDELYSLRELREMRIGNYKESDIYKVNGKYSTNPNTSKERFDSLEEVKKYIDNKYNRDSLASTNEEVTKDLEKNLKNFTKDEIVTRAVDLGKYSKYDSLVMKKANDFNVRLYGEGNLVKADGDLRDIRSFVNFLNNYHSAGARITDSKPDLIQIFKISKKLVR